MAVADSHVASRCHHLLDAIGNTPLLELSHVNSPDNATILAKAEFLNPGGSIKDRIARFIIGRAEQRGELRPGSTILEVTSGNTGIGLAMVGAAKGYRVVILMPEAVTAERRSVIRAFGAELELMPDGMSMIEARDIAERRAASDPNIYLPRQFANPDNVLDHVETTGPEIVAQAGPVDAFVMGIGTGGTLMGVGAVLRRHNPRVQIVAMEPAESAMLSGECPCHHGIQGLAEGFIPELVELSKIDRIVKVRTAGAIAMAKKLHREEGLFVGISSGANLLAAMEVARDLGPGKRVVTVLADRGDRYLSLWD